MEKRCDNRRDGTQCFHYNVSLLVPRNGPLPVVLKHSHPLPLANLCKCQKENLCPKRREEQEVDAGPQSSLAPTCSLPDSSIKKKITQKFTAML